jgi:hypothetical protein
MSFSEIIAKIKSLTPLKIIDIKLAGEQLIIEGENCFIVCSIALWRIISNNCLLVGCFSDDNYKILEIKGLEILNIQTQSIYINADIALELSNGWILEFFSANYLEPWSFKYKNDSYYSDPSNPNWTV